MNLTIEIPDDRASRYQATAKAQGLTMDRWLLELADQSALPTESTPVSDRPIWEAIAENMKDVPDEAYHKLPADAAGQVDHYLYGHPKR